MDIVIIVVIGFIIYSFVKNNKGIFNSSINTQITADSPQNELTDYPQLSEIESDSAIQNLIAFCKALKGYNDYRAHSNNPAHPRDTVWELNSQLHYAPNDILDNLSRININFSIDGRLMLVFFHIDGHGNQLSDYCKTIGTGGPYLLVPATNMWASNFDQALQEHWGGASIQYHSASFETDDGEAYTYYSVMENNIALKYNKCESLYIDCVTKSLKNSIPDVRINLNGFSGSIYV